MLSCVAKLYSECSLCHPNGHGPNPSIVIISSVVGGSARTVLVYIEVKRVLWRLQNQETSQQRRSTVRERHDLELCRGLRVDFPLDELDNKL
jgi:hypothetical protein